MNNKNLYSLIIAVFVGVHVSAMSTWDGTSVAWTKGSGTIVDPYLIESPQQLAYLSDMVAGGISNYQGEWFKQIDDFDMAGSSYSWTPIGTSTSVFKGNYDGDNRFIKNVRVSPITDYNYRCFGVFGCVKNDTIEKLSVENVSFSNAMAANGYSACAGGIVGSASNSYFYKCVSKSNISFSYSMIIGGVVGSCSDCTFIDCENLMSLTASDEVGGIIGSATNCTMERCVNIGNVMGNSYNYSDAAGGLIGILSGNLLMSNCYVRADVHGDYRTGGLIGEYRSSTGIIRNSYYAGNISGSSKNAILEIIGGYGYRLTSTNVYYLSTCGASSSSGSPKLESLMKSESFPVILNGENDAMFYMDEDNINEGYPILAYQRDLSVEIATTCNSQAGVIIGGGRYNVGEHVNLTVIPFDGYIFKCWSDGNTQNPRPIVVSGATNFVAQFIRQSYTIIVGQDCTSTIE